MVVWLYPSQPPAQLIPGTFNGVLAEGTITAANLVGPLAGMDFSDLITAMEAGNAYVNIPTSAHPGGEIRGQIR
ncbi:MAG: CHRD domain-containing protein [Dehalococcoidales bacterium]|nr:CHRD domain-containing protein [Dehalococcoidales bacterium]